MTADGGIKLIRSGGAVSFSAFDPDHAELFLNKRGPDAHVVVFEVDPEFHQQIMDGMVKQENSKGKAIQESRESDDYSETVFLMSPEYVKKLEKHAFNARVLNSEDFRREYISNR